MRVLIVSANRELVPDPVFPLGAAYVASAARESGHDTDVLDICFADDISREVKDKISSFGPDLVGVSIRNVDNVAYPLVLTYAEGHKNLIDEIRSSHFGPIVMGGPAFTLMPEEFLDFTGVEMGILGEGEDAIVKLADSLENGGSLDKVPGLITREAGKTLQRNGNKTRVDVNKICTPARDLLDSAAYQKWGGMVGIQTKRGCPIDCIYCTYPVVEGKDIRLRDPGAIVDEIEKTNKEYGADTFFIVDNVFNNPPEHAIEVAEEIKRRKIGLRFSAYMNPGFVSERLLGVLKDAGFTGVDYGVDSLSEGVLKNLRKNFTKDNVVRAVELTRGMGIECCLSMIFGGPGETLDTLKETVDSIDEIAPTAVLAIVGIRLYSGTGMHKIAKRDRVVGEEGVGLKPVFYISPDVADEVVGFVAEASLKRNNWLFPGHMIMAGQQLTPDQKPERYDQGPLAEFRKQGIKGNLWEMFGAMK
ncbi:MAG: radical SAM protein [Deltaproteobacteria bacterium]|uniref:Radical SAM protein n=1 Tax=Candidatus Zymogenus saltonus TaxID=2844893 RepID=A0A9D8KDM5_9DELT|nr:radical SAM protein [Candidatus Zymogenus saltonus]